LLSLSILGYTFLTTGSPVELGVEFKGGTAIIFDSAKTPDELKAEFQGYPVTQAREYGGGQRRILQFGPMDQSLKDNLIKKVKSESINPETVEIKDMGEQFSKSLQGQALQAVLISFILMSIIVFIIFRTFVPSVAVVVSAFADIAFAAAMMDVFGIALSLGTVAALLMLIGYSVDTDILLTTRLLKRKGELKEKMKEAMKTGLTMTGTTMAVLLTIFFVSSGSYLISSFTRIDIIRDISIVLIFGLIADVINTWMTNMGILKWYIEQKEHAQKPAGKLKKREKRA
jgi:preprotein translocase subunit SecF